MQGRVETLWARATLNGRPLLAVVEPVCPSQPVDVERILLLTPAERLACYGSADVILAPAMLATDPPAEPVFCAGPDVAVPTVCPDSVSSPAWLTEPSMRRVFGSRGTSSPAGGLGAWLDPALSEIPDGQWVRVTGHFDDPSSATCTWTHPDGFDLTGVGLLPDEQVLTCRERFVITSFQRIDGP